MSDLKRPRVVCIIEARFRSSRLPGKVTKPIMGTPMLARMIERVSRARMLDAIVVACPVGTEDDVIAAIAFETGVFCFRGSEDDVLARVVGAAESNRADVIVTRTETCDCSQS